jgi:hypothetical protein
MPGVAIEFVISQRAVRGLVYLLAVGVVGAFDSRTCELSALGNNRLSYTVLRLRRRFSSWQWMETTRAKC